MGVRDLPEPGRAKVPKDTGETTLLQEAMAKKGMAGWILTVKVGERRIDKARVHFAGEEKLMKKMLLQLDDLTRFWGYMWMTSWS